jgi:hypothetical protein
VAAGGELGEGVLGGGVGRERREREEQRKGEIGGEEKKEEVVTVGCGEILRRVGSRYVKESQQ